MDYGWQWKDTVRTVDDRTKAGNVGVRLGLKLGLYY